VGDLGKNENTEGVEFGDQNGGQKRAEEEHACEEETLVDTKRPDHLPVLGRGTDQGAPARAMEQQPQDTEHQRSQDDKGEIVFRQGRAEYIDGAVEPRRARPQNLLRPPDQERRIAHHQHDAESGDELEQLGRAVDGPQHHEFHDDADDTHGHRRHQHRAPEPEHAARQ
jgi:hypothetical protein